jgi:hypothetical protein
MRRIVCRVAEVAEHVEVVDNERGTGGVGESRSTCMLIRPPITRASNSRIPSILVLTSRAARPNV